MAFNMAEAKTRITVQTEGQEKISSLENSVRDLSAEVKKFAASAAVGGNAASVMAGKAQAAAAQTTAVGKSAGLAGHQMQNLAYQFNDVVVSLASGQNPMMVFMQQGSQIGQIMASAGVGVGGLVKQIGGAIGGFLVANPLIAAGAAVVGVAAAAFGLMSSEINKNSKVHVTWMDTVLGAWDAAKSYLSDKLTKAFEFFGIKTEDVWKSVVNVTKWAVNWVIGVVSLVPRMVIAAFSIIAPAIGDAFYSGVNLAIKGLNWLIRKTVDGVNFIVDAFNTIIPDSIKLPRITAPQIDELANQYAGGLKKYYSVMGSVMKESFTRDFIGEGAAYLSPFAEARARERLAEDAKDAGGKAGKEAGKAAGKGFLDGLTEQLNKDKAQLMGQMAGVMTGLAAANDDEMAAMRAEMSRNTKARTQPGVEAGIASFNSFKGGSLRGIQEFAAQIGSLGERAFDTWNRALLKTEDTLVNFVMTGKLNFKDLANSIIADLVRIAIQQAIMKPLTNFLGGLFANGGAFLGGNVLANANGNAFLNGNVTPFANGGVVTRPTLFPMARGAGLMGEAGPEAVMPLRRLSNGRLGVEAAGGGNASVTVNVDASGSSVSGDQGKAGDLGKAIASVVQAELVRQKRPGGLLAA